MIKVKDAFKTPVDVHGIETNEGLESSMEQDRAAEVSINNHDELVELVRDLRRAFYHLHKKTFCDAPQRSDFKAYDKAIDTLKLLGVEL